MSTSGDSTATTRPGVLLRLSLVLFGVFVLFGVGVLVSPASPWSQPLDDWWRALVGVGPDASAPHGVLATFFQQFGQPVGALATLVVLPLLLALVGRWRSALFVVAAQLLGPALVSQGAKNLVDRPRPATDEAAGLSGPLFTVDHGSFPSGHAVSMGLFVVIVLALIPVAATRWHRIWTVIGALLVLGMIWQRTLINAHWLTDTVAGTIAGIATGLLMWWAFWPWLRRDEGRRPWFAASAAASGPLGPDADPSTPLTQRTHS